MRIDVVLCRDRPPRVYDHDTQRPLHGNLLSLTIWPRGGEMVAAVSILKHDARGMPYMEAGQPAQEVIVAEVVDVRGEQRA